MAQALAYDVAYALFFILPAWAANGFPVLFGGGRPIDGGRTWSDGKPVFGSHKTIRGFVAGMIAGTVVGAVETAALPLFKPYGFEPPFNFTVLLAFLISLGALTGDLVHSFVKRRMNLKEGASLPIADQLDFAVGAVLISFLVSPPTPVIILIILIITLPVHLLTNLVAYLAGVKKTPW